jgi:hypothetical protein
MAILLSILFGEQNTTASGPYCTGGEINLISTSPVAFFAHLITLFARSSTFTGIVRPISVAALRLMMN